MTRRLATICLMTMFLYGISSPPAPAQDTERTRRSLKGITAIEVLVEDLPDGAKLLGLTKESIKTDVELKLRLAGIRVVTPEESLMIPGMPELYVNITLTDGAEAGSIDVQLNQNVMLERNGQLAIGATTWDTGVLLSHPTAEGIRNSTKDHVDKFLNAWLSSNPKK